MTRVASLVFVLLTAAAFASPQSLTITVGQSASIPAPGATAAYVVDPTLADVTIAAGAVQVTGRRAGTTNLVILAADDVLTYDVRLTAPLRQASSTPTSPAIAATVWDASYSSETERLTTSVDSTSRDGRKTTRVSATNVTRIGDAQSDVRSSMASASIDMTNGARRVTLLDQLVRSSALTLDGSRVRGVHYTDASFDLHAGLSSPLLYRSVILPAEPDAVIGAGYTGHRGTLSLGPSLYWYPKASGFGGATGLAAGLHVKQTAAGGRFRVSGEGGYGGEMAAATDLAYDGTRHNLSFTARHRPSGYPSLGAVSPYGSSFDGQYGTRLTQRLTFHLATSGARQELPVSKQTTAASSAELRAALGRHWAVTVASNVSLFDNGVDRLTSVTVPVGAGWETSRRGLTGLFRYQQNTARNNGGLGGRVRAHASVGRITVGGFVDYQRDAATVGLVFRESPELARLFAELGLQTRTPEDLARLLREQGDLVSSGYLERATLILNPRRVQTSVDASWSSRGNGTRARFSVLADRVESTHGTGDHFIETISLTHRLTRLTEITGAATWWTSSNGILGAGHRSYALGLRLRGNALTDVMSWLRRDAIAGRVLRDDSDRASAAVKPPMPGVRVRLDDGREVVTDADGRFRFIGVGRGPRHVEALLPAAAGARFATPAIVVARPGDNAVFNIGYVAARLIGSVHDDVAAPIAGVHIRATCAGAEETAVSDSTGRYAMGGAEGECRVSVEGSTLPPGYDATNVPDQTVRLTRDAPARADYVVRANRSLAGTVTPLVGTATAAGTVTVRLVETGAEQHVDADGRFVFRNLKPGVYTVAVEIRGRRFTRVIVVPEGPAIVKVVLDLN